MSKKTPVTPSSSRNLSLTKEESEQLVAYVRSVPSSDFCLSLSAEDETGGVHHFADIAGSPGLQPEHLFWTLSARNPNTHGFIEVYRDESYLRCVAMMMRLVSSQIDTASREQGRPPEGATADAMTTVRETIEELLAKLGMALPDTEAKPASAPGTVH